MKNKKQIKTFPQEDELKQKTKRIDELNILLNMNEKDNEVLDSGDIEEKEDLQNKNSVR